MRTRVARAILTLTETGEGINALRQAPGVPERYGRLERRVPEMLSWDTMARHQLLFFLHHGRKIDFGVCPHYLMDGDKIQRCSIGGYECTCWIPQTSCVFWDPAENPQIPVFFPYLTVALEEQLIEEMQRLMPQAQASVV